MMEFDSNGNYQAGIHKISLDDLNENLIANFNSSETRTRNFDGFMNYLDHHFFTDYKFMFTKLWIDGSFTTNKNNPNDIDVILFINPLLDYEKANFFMNIYYEYIKKSGIENKYFSDVYILLDVDSLPIPESVTAESLPLPEMTIEDYEKFYRNIDYQTKYWMGQFCFDRKRNPKGIFELSYVKGEFENE